MVNNVYNDKYIPFHTLIVFILQRVKANQTLTPENHALHISYMNE